VSAAQQLGGKNAAAAGAAGAKGIAGATGQGTGGATAANPRGMNADGVIDIDKSLTSDN